MKSAFLIISLVINRNREKKDKIFGEWEIHGMVEMTKKVPETKNEANKKRKLECKKAIITRIKKVNRWRKKN